MFQQNLAQYIRYASMTVTACGRKTSCTSSQLLSVEQGMLASAAPVFACQ